MSAKLDREIFSVFLSHYVCFHPFISNSLQEASNSRGLDLTEYLIVANNECHARIWKGLNNICRNCCSDERWSLARIWQTAFLSNGDSGDDSRTMVLVSFLSLHRKFGKLCMWDQSWSTGCSDGARTGIEDSPSFVDTKYGSELSSDFSLKSDPRKFLFFSFASIKRSVFLIIISLSGR
jgi:hypothetical protein